MLGAQGMASAGVFTAHDSEPTYRQIVRTWREQGPITRPWQVAAMLAPKVRNATQEIAFVVSVDIYATLIDIHEVARGARDHVDIEIPVALEHVLKDGTNYFILVHNHPSGSGMPSTADGELTWAMAEAAQVAGMVLLDHVVLGRDREFFSFYEGSLCRTRS
jgi:DNA repair protein RadC